MNAKQLEALLTMCAEVAQHSPTLLPHRVASVMWELQKLAASLHRRYECACSYEWANTDKYERRTEKLETKCAHIATLVPGLEVEHQRDPRGWPLVIKMNGRELGRLG